MKQKKIIIIALAVFLLLPTAVIHADDISDMKATVGDMMSKLIAKYESRIQTLETENANLKSELTRLKNVPGNTAITPATVTSVSTVPLSGTGKTDAYSAIMKSINANLPNILSENTLDGSGVIGLFEFIEPNAVFISIDDGKNPAEVSAFKTKILYTFDNNLSLTRIGLFDLDYASQKYRTVFGTNPYTKSTRVRIQNPLYNGKLFEVTMTNTGSTASATNTPATETTFAQIKAAYDKKKDLDVLKLSETYILKSPSDIEVLRMRYRSYYMIGKYEDSLAEVKKIESLQGSNFDKIIACDAAVI